MITDLLSMEDLDEATITQVLDTAENFKDLAVRPIKKVPVLRGRTVCNLFYEDSTRTRISFEVGIAELGAPARAQHIREVPLPLEGVLDADRLLPLRIAETSK